MSPLTGLLAPARPGAGCSPGAQRTPWLLFFSVGLMMCASVMHNFEALLARELELAFFVPLLIGSGGNSGPGRGWNPPALGHTRAAILPTLGRTCPSSRAHHPCVTCGNRPPVYTYTYAYACIHIHMRMRRPPGDRSVLDHRGRGPHPQPSPSPLTSHPSPLALHPHPSPSPLPQVSAWATIVFSILTD